MRKEICKLLSISEKSYYNYKEQQRPIMIFLERYFTKEELAEFLETDSIKSLENKRAFNKYITEGESKEFLATGKINKFEKNILINDLFKNIENEYADFFLQFPRQLKAYFYLLAHSAENTRIYNSKYKILEFLKEEKLGMNDVVHYFEETKISPILELYIDFNISNDWVMLKNSDLPNWIINYHEICIEAIQKELYDIVFTGWPGLLTQRLPVPPSRLCSLDDEIEYRYILQGIRKKITENNFTLKEPLIEYGLRYSSKDPRFDEFRKYYLY